MSSGSSDFSSGSSSSSDSELETTTSLKTRTVTRKFMFLKHKVTSIPRGAVKIDLQNSGRIRDVSFSPKLTKDQLRNLLQSSMPCLANVPVDELQIYRSTSRGSKIIKVADSLPSAKDLVELFKGTKSKSILLRHKKASKKRRFRALQDESTKKNGHNSSEEQDKEDSNVYEEEQFQDREEHVATNTMEDHIQIDPHEEHDIVQAELYQGNGIIVGKFCKDDIETVRDMFGMISQCKEELSSYDLLLRKSMASKHPYQADDDMDDEVVFGADAPPYANAEESTLVLEDNDDKQDDGPTEGRSGERDRNKRRWAKRRAKKAKQKKENKSNV